MIIYGQQQQEQLLQKGCCYLEEMFKKLEKLKYGEESINESNRLSKFWKELDGSKRDWLDLIEYIYDYKNDD